MKIKIKKGIRRETGIFSKRKCIASPNVERENGGRQGRGSAVAEC